MDEEGIWRWVEGTLLDTNIFDTPLLLNNADINFPPGDPRKKNADCEIIQQNLEVRDDNCEIANPYVCRLNL